ncbi:cell division control protein 6 homolog isoform X2 [Wolffia australiana]
MANTPTPRRGRSAVVAEETEPSRDGAAHSPNRKRKSRDQPSPASPVSSTPQEKRSSLTGRVSCNADTKEGIAKIANTGITCCSPKSPRKRLFAGSPQRSRWNPADPVQLSAAKEAFHLSSPPTTVACRDSEQNHILELCKTCIKQGIGGSLYVCGCPGTGKTLSVKKVEELLVAWTKEVGLQSPITLSISCTSLTSTSQIFPKILERCCLQKVTGASSPLQKLRDSISKRKPPFCERSVLVILDELDYLITKDRAVLHDLFALTTIPSSPIVLIGIANAIDLADRFLPKLESLSCKPSVVTFRAYNKDQILEILNQRLSILGYEVFDAQALEFCARKVAAASGDMRRALSVCLGAIEQFEKELKMDEKEKKMELVGFNHMDYALSKAFRTPVVETIQSLPQHQQIILCALVNLLKRRKTSTVGDLNKSYLEVCKSVQVAAAGATEFSSMCRVLGDQVNYPTNHINKCANVCDRRAMTVYSLVNCVQGLIETVGNKTREEMRKTVGLAVDAADVVFSLKVGEEALTAFFQLLCRRRSRNEARD